MENDKEPRTFDCPECNGSGFHVQAECCQDQWHVERGGCCQKPIPVQEPCEKCKSTGKIEISADQYDDEMHDREADLRHDDI